MAHRRIAACAGLALLLAAGSPAALRAQDACGAVVAVQLAENDPDERGTRLRFTAELTAPETCRNATWDLVLVELLPDGQWKSVRRTRTVEVRDGMASDSVEHAMAAGLKLLEYEARVFDCSPCR